MIVETLLASGGDRDRLTTSLLKFRGRVASKYGELLKSVISMDATLGVTWSHPSGTEVRRATLSVEAAREALLVVEAVKTQLAEPFDVVGTLIGINVRTKTFEINDDQGQKFAGRIRDEGMPTAEHATMNSRYNASLVEVKETGEATAEERISFELLAIQPA